jgi:HEAT repeat protein
MLRTCGSAIVFALAVVTAAVTAAAGAPAAEADPRRAAFDRALEQGDVNAAFTAMEGLALSGGAMAEAALAKAFESPNAWVRRGIVRSMGVMGGQAAVDICIRAMSDADALVRIDACGVGARLGTGEAKERIAAALVMRMRDRRTGVRAEAAHALGAIRDARTTDALDDSARHDAEQSVRSAAIEAMGRIGGSIAALAARDLIERDDDDRVRAAAANALAWIAPDFAGDVLAAALRDTSGRVRLAAAAALGAIGTPRAVNALESALALDDDDVHAESVRALGHAGSQLARAALRNGLVHASSIVRRGCAQTLGHLADAESMGSLTKLVGDRDPDVRGAAVEALGRFADVKAAEAVRAAFTDRSGEVRARAAEAGGRIGDRESINALASLARPAFSEGERVAAISAMGFLGDLRAAQILTVLLQDQSEPVRRVAASALAHLGTGGEALVDATEAFTGRARLDYLGALAVIREPKARKLFEQEMQAVGPDAAEFFVCRVGLYVLGDAQHRQTVWDGARGAAGGVNPGLALTALVLAGDPDARELAAQILKAGGPGLREGAALALGVARPAWAGPLLKLAVGDPDASVALRARVAQRWFELRGPRT